MNWLQDTILRWEGPAPPAQLLADGNITAVLDDKKTPLRQTAWDELASVPPDEIVAVTNGLWPGVMRAPTGERDPDTWVASASHQPWVNANGYLISCLRAVRPTKPALLEHAPSKDLLPPATLEIALVEAKVWGGNALLAPTAAYREDLLAGREKAVASWKQMGRVARWLGEQRALFGHPVSQIVTQVVDATGGSAELANLLYRHGASPAVVSVATIPAPDPARRLVLVAAGLARVSDAARDAILRHAAAGSTVVTDSPDETPWWRNSALKLTKKEEDREFYALGSGRLVAYFGAISDPSEFALDVIDLVMHKRRALRFWDAPTVVGFVTEPRTGARALTHLVNYGEPRKEDFPLRVQGVFRKAMLLRPEQPSVALPVAKRGTTTEVRVPGLGRVGVLAFQ